MTILHVDLSDKLLTADQEVELARRIEAGVYADHLITRSSFPPHPDLEDVRDRGAAAWRELWTKNLRLVMKLAMEYAHRFVLPVDDLFQEGCIGLGHAMRHFDHTRGVRFATLAHKYIRHIISKSAAQRCGALEGPAYRQRIRRLIRQAEPDGSRGTDLVGRAERLGISAELAVASHVQVMPIEEVAEDTMAVDGGFDAVEVIGTDFLELLDEGVAEFLRLRFGIGCPPRSVDDLARAMRMSPSSVRRVESRALDMARAVLAQDQCLMPPRRRRAAQLAA